MHLLKIFKITEMNRQVSSLTFATVCLLAISQAKVLHQPRHHSKGHGPSPFTSVGADVKTIVYDDKRFTSRLTPKEVLREGNPNNMPEIEALKHIKKTSHNKGGKLKQAADSTDLVNTSNLRYTGSVYMGNDLIEVDDIVFDTGSSWFVLETSDCTDCTETYDYTAQTTYTEVGESIDVAYADGTTVDGVTATDDVCLSADATDCVNAYKWMNAQTYGLPVYLNGILGMAADPEALSWHDPLTAKSWVQELYAAGVIDADSFSVAMRDENDSDGSYIDYGTPDSTAMTDSADLVWIDVYDDSVYGQFWWQALLQGIRLRPQVDSSTDYATSVAAAEGFDTSADNILGITDTGSSCLSLPGDLYNFVIRKLVQYLSYTEYDQYWGYLFYCTDVTSLPSMDILFGDYWFEVLVDDYVINFGNNVCGMCI